MDWNSIIKRKMLVNEDVKFWDPSLEVHEYPEGGIGGVFVCSYPDTKVVLTTEQAKALRDVLIELFPLESPEWDDGVYTHDREGNLIQVGTQTPIDLCEETDFKVGD